MIANPRLAAGLFVIGVVGLLLSEAELMRVLSAVVLLISLALGVFAIATPEFTAGDDGESRR